MVINHNMSSEFANRLMETKGLDITRNIEKLSSGMRINRAGDDASGLAVSKKMQSQVRGLQQAAKNIQDGISFIQTAEGYLGSTENILGRIRELSIQAANGIYSNEDRAQIQVEVSQMVDEIDRIASHAQFNGLNMLTGRFAGDSSVGSLFLHVGANMDQRVGMSVGTMTAAGLGLTSTTNTTPPQAAPAGDGTAVDQAEPAATQVQAENSNSSGRISIMTVSDANMAIGKVDSALNKVLKQRANLGAYQNRFEMAMEGINIGRENLVAAESRIEDVNMAKEMSDFMKNQILLQSSSAMIAQANQKNNAVMRVLG